jgi:hypothetical protein
MTWTPTSTKYHEASILFDDDAQTKIRSGWTLHLGGDPFPLELNEKQAAKLHQTGRQVAMERGRFEPEPTRPPSDADRSEGCAHMRALAGAVPQAIQGHANSCTAMGDALETMRMNHTAAITDLELWGKTADADAAEPCGYALEASLKAALTRCRSELPQWTRVLLY